MKKNIALFCAILLFISNSFSQTKDIAGIWEGKLKVGVELRLVFHFTKQNDSTFSVKMDSPDQGVKGLDCSNLTFVNDSIKVEVKVAHGAFKGALVNDSTINGEWLQGPINLPLMLRHVQQVTELNRPQTPKPPFDYNVDSVEYDNADKTVHLAATFTYPKTAGPFVTLLMITGSGQQDRDETMLGHKPFAVIADYLTKKGYAVLRVDDRQRGLSTGDLKTATTADFANDALTSFNYLMTRKEVDKNKIGLIGHSEGGLIAPMVYVKDPKVAFIISLAGTGVSGAQILLRQQTDPLKNVVSDAAFQANFLLVKNTLQIIHNNAPLPDSLILDKEKDVFTGWKKSLPDSILKTLHADNASPEMYAKQVKSELLPWLKYFIATDPSQFWDKVKCPVLVLNGSKDVQVYPDENVPAITGALKNAGDKNVTVKIFPGLNHLFQHCITCTTHEYGDLTETIAPEVLQQISGWLDATVKNKKAK